TGGGEGEHAMVAEALEPPTLFLLPPFKSFLMSFEALMVLAGEKERFLKDKVRHTNGNSQVALTLSGLVVAAQPCSSMDVFI
nr:hypothetical protein [Tanacetum cinerariifolium]